jgi:GT2 family glycosyltransferase
MLLSIIIVNYNTKKLTLACLESIFIHLGTTIAFEVIIVDNGSRDGSPEAIRAMASNRNNVHLIEAGANLGFAKGNNIGISKASGKQVLLLNSDTYLVDDSILRAISYIEERPEVFGCGCTLLNADGSVGISYGKFPELGIVLLEILTWRFGRFRAMIPRRPFNIYSIDFPCGAFFLVRHELLEKVGLLDESFFMYTEETDWAKRAKKAGYRIMYFGPTRVVHLRGQSSAGEEKIASRNGESPPDSKTLMYKSWKHYLEKHCLPLSTKIIGLVVPLFFRANSLIFHVLRRERARDQYAKEIRAFRSGWSIERPVNNE